MAIAISVLSVPMSTLFSIGGTTAVFVVILYAKIAPLVKFIYRNFIILDLSEPVITVTSGRFTYLHIISMSTVTVLGQDECSISISPEEDDVSRYRQSLDISSRSKSATNFGLKKQSSSEQFDSSSNRKSQEPTHVYSSPEIKPTPLQENEDSVRAFPPPSPRVISTHKVNFDRDDAVDVETNDTVDHMAEEYNTSHSTFPDASSHVLQYKGYPYCVLKTRTTTSGDKVFINICFHSTIPGLDIIIGEDCPRTVLGKGGEMCYVYDVCVGKASLEDNVIQNDTYNRVVRLLNTACRAKLEDQFSIPKIKKNFKGDHSSHFIQTEGMPTPPTSPDHKQKAPVSPVANGGSNDSSNGDISGDDSGESKRIDESSLPASYRGWVLREEGTLLKSFKRRYMVLDRGVLTSYKNPTTADDADDLIARESEGKTMSFTIDSFTTLELIEGRNKAKLTSTQLYLRDGKDNRTDMLFDTDSIEDHSGWVQAILLHMEYIKQARRRNSV